LRNGRQFGRLYHLALQHSNGDLHLLVALLRQKKIPKDLGWEHRIVIADHQTRRSLEIRRHPGKDGAFSRTVSQCILDNLVLGFGSSQELAKFRDLVYGKSGTFRDNGKSGSTKCRCQLRNCCRFLFCIHNRTLPLLRCNNPTNSIPWLTQSRRASRQAPSCSKGSRSSDTVLYTRPALP